MLILMLRLVRNNNGFNSRYVFQYWKKKMSLEELSPTSFNIRVNAIVDSRPNFSCSVFMIRIHKVAVLYK